MIKNPLPTFEKWLDSQTPKHRGVALLVAFSVSYLVWTALLQWPLHAGEKKILRQIATIETQKKDYEKKISELKKEIGQRSNPLLSEQKKQLEAQIQRIDTDLESTNQTLIPTDAFVDLLRKSLVAIEGLKFNTMETLPHKTLKKPLQPRTTTRKIFNDKR